MGEARRDVRKLSGFVVCLGLFFSSHAYSQDVNEVRSEIQKHWDAWRLPSDSQNDVRWRFFGRLREAADEKICSYENVEMRHAYIRDSYFEGKFMEVSHYDLAPDTTANPEACHMRVFWRVVDGQYDADLRKRALDALYLDCQVKRAEKLDLGVTAYAIDYTCPNGTVSFLFGVDVPPAAFILSDEQHAVTEVNGINVGLVRGPRESTFQDNR